MANIPENIAFVVGAGAVENAWTPVLNAVNKIYSAQTDADGANCIFARLVYLLRFYSTGTLPDAKKILEEGLKFTQEIKNEISKELIAAEKSGIIKARQEFKAILYKFIFSVKNKSLLISTNWDTVINNEINRIGQGNHPNVGSKIPTNHIHGSITEPNGIYLPSELTLEPYRTKEESTKIGTIHGDIWRAIESSTKTILYGLSLDPLDAELSQTLATGWNSDLLKEIIIINPNHKQVANRVKLLIDSKRKIKISGYDPGHLENETLY